MWAGIISGTRRTFFFCFSSFHFLSSIFSDVHRARAGGDEQREGWRRCWTNSLLSGLASVCEWHTPCSREGQRMGFKNCLFQTLPTLMRERIESASLPAGSISSIQDLMARYLLKWANHNTQNEWRKCPVEYVPCCATRAGLCWAGHAASQQACVILAFEILFFQTERMENCNYFSQILVWPTIWHRALSSSLANV